jgi:hypothetical protein
VSVSRLFFNFHRQKQSRKEESVSTNKMMASVAQTNSNKFSIHRVYNGQRQAKLSIEFWKLTARRMAQNKITYSSEARRIDALLNCATV